jgi:LPS-assembly lipoprotein
MSARDRNASWVGSRRIEAGRVNATRARAPVVVALMTAVLALSACGFRLQGREPLPAALSRTLVIAENPQTDFVQGLRRALITSGGKLTERSEQATGIVRIRRDEVTRKILSVSANNTPREYEVTYTVEFSVDGTAGQLMPPQKLSLARDYSFDETKLLAKENEEAILREGMARDLVAIVMRRLSTI